MDWDRRVQLVGFLRGLGNKPWLAELADEVERLADVEAGRVPVGVLCCPEHNGVGDPGERCSAAPRFGPQGPCTVYPLFYEKGRSDG